MHLPPTSFQLYPSHCPLSFTSFPLYPFPCPLPSARSPLHPAHCTLYTAPFPPPAPTFCIGVCGCQPQAVVQIIVLGGHDGTAWLENVTTHRPLTKHWGRLGHLDSPRSFAAAETWRDSVYIMGGGDGSQWFSSVLRCVALAPSTHHYQGFKPSTW